MPIEPQEIDLGKRVDTADALVKDIVGRWPVWKKIVEEHGPHHSSAYMAIATHLFSAGMAAMLEAQVAPAEILDAAGELFDLYTDPEYLAKMAALRDDKDEIMRFIASMLEANMKKMAKHRKAN